MEQEHRLKIKTFMDLDAWREAHALALMVYKLTRSFPREEMFGITSQMRRAAISIGSNIAEGFSRYSHKEKIHFYSIAQGSTTELQSQLLLARDIGFIDMPSHTSAMHQSVIVHKLINGLIKHCQRSHT